MTICADLVELTAFCSLSLAHRFQWRRHRRPPSRRRTFEAFACPSLISTRCAFGK